MLRSGFFLESTLGDGTAFWIIPHDSRIRLKKLDDSTDMKLLILKAYDVTFFIQIRYFLSLR